MINLVDVSKQYGSKILLKNASAFIGQRSRVALIGPNGAGKSTLIRILLGHEFPDEGLVSRAKHLAIGHLAQEMPKLSDCTVLEEVMRLDGRREELLRVKRQLESHFEKSANSELTDDHEADLQRYGRILEELEHLDEYRLESRAKEILAGMGFKAADFTRTLSEFSGGWLMRVALSRVLLINPDLLLLDEPTNHLDLESLLWLEEFLDSHQGALLLVSHDRAFLNRIVGEVLEIDQRKLFTYKGNIDSYIEQKQQRLELLEAQHAGQQAKIAEIQDFVRRFGAKATKARQAQSRLKQLEKIEANKIELPEDGPNVRFRFPPAPHSGKEVVTVKNAAFAYEGKPIFSDLNWILPRGARIAIVGVNGAGKTTLLKLIAGQLLPSSGTLKHGHQVVVGYYAQHQIESLGLKNTILEELYESSQDTPLPQIRSIAGAFLFSGDAVEKKCSVLSGGEKARVALAKLLLSPSNFLLLDEPTNHLDIESRGVLLEALQGYEGTLCLISHDRDFVGPLVDQVLEIIPGEKGSRVIPLIGGYEDYLERKVRETQESRLINAPKSQGSTPLPLHKNASTAKPNDNPIKTKPSSSQLRTWAREREKVESAIATLETRQNELAALLGDSDLYHTDKLKALDYIEQQRQVENDLEQKLARWEELCRLLEEAAQ